MKATKLKFCTITTLTIILVKLGITFPVYSQSITPGKDNTKTTINQNGNQFDIQGGTYNGSNLFHSFDQFKVEINQTANFLTNPDTSNIFGRVTGGNASILNGLIQVTGSNSNLFLMNPAGIIFGPNVRLNIPASFNVTTASGIGFNNNNFWFKAMETNDYSTLTGNPSGYKFNSAQLGQIVNEGNLSLNPGKNLTLLGGTVINRGQLSTAGGNIIIVAVKDSGILRISRPGHVLSLEFNPNKADEKDISSFLTGGDKKHATSIRVDPDGSVMLTDNASIDVSSSDQIGGQVHVLGEQVSLIDANIKADGLNGGGTVLIRGKFQDNSIVPRSPQTLMNQNSFISADAISNGDGGKVIVLSDGITNFEGNISAKGGENSGDGGFVEVSGKQELNFNGPINVSAKFGNRGTILLDPEDIILGGSESNTSLDNLEGNIILQADNDITINENIERDSSIQLQAGRSININANINTSSGNEDINLFGNNGEINSANRSDGVASINQLNGTTLNAGNGAINIQLGNLGEVGDINLANLTTTGQVLVNANGGNISRVSENSLITAGNGLFITKDSGGIGLENQPLRLNVNFLEAVAGNSGVFFNLESSTVNIGGVNEEVNGISTIAGGDIVLKSTNNVNATEDIFADVADSAPGGNIEIEANNLNVTDGAQISASTFGSGDAGKVDIAVEDTVIFDGVSSDGFASGAIIGVGEGSAGNVGDINIETDFLRVTNGAQISVITLGDGNVGGIDITANNVVFDGVSANGVSGAFSRVGAEAEGNAAGVSITTSSLEVTNGAQISSNTLGQGTAGNISIQADSSLIISEDSQISTLTESAAGGGNIIIVPPNNIDFQGDGEITVGSSGSGNPGNIITTINSIPNQEIPVIPSNTSSEDEPLPNPPAPPIVPVIPSNTSSEDEPLPNPPAPPIVPVIPLNTSSQDEPLPNPPAPPIVPVIPLNTSSQDEPLPNPPAPPIVPVIPLNTSSEDEPLPNPPAPPIVPVIPLNTSSQDEPLPNPLAPPIVPVIPLNTSSQDEPLPNPPAPPIVPVIPLNTSSQNNPPPISRDLLQITTPRATDQISGIMTQPLLPLALETKYNTNPLTVATGNVKSINTLEQNWNKEYFYYFGDNFNEQLLNQKSFQEVLKDIANQTGTDSAVVYVQVYPEHLQLILNTKNENEPIIKIISPVKRKELMKVLLKFRTYITSPNHRHTNSYLSPAQQLYNWLITPISKELEAANIKTLLFSMDKGLRTLPIAALHDGKQFLIEKYSLGLIPSFSLIDTRYRKYELQNTQVLAMGASQFIKQNSLPSVPVELEIISEQLWRGSQFINEDFTKSNLLAQRQDYPYPIIHLATHAEFRPGEASNSYIQLWGSEQIKLNEMRKLGWNEPTVELLVLSACRTAVGDKNAELGFAGLAIGSGVKSVLASIWYVSDEGTLGLMTEFYSYLNNVKVKAEALRQAQLAMLRGEVVITEGNLIMSGGNRVVELPPNLRNLGNLKFSHPYYWSGFTMIGSPW